MADELIPLSQIADIIGGYAFKSDDFGSTGFPVVKIASIEPPRVNLTSGEKISSEKVSGLDRFRLNDRDIVMAMTGATIGKAGRVRSNEPAYLNQRVAKLAAKAGRKFDDFIYALVSQVGFDEEVLTNSNGSAQANISTDGIGRILVPDFSPAGQIQIGRIIGSLDDKIELNRRMNETLEALAQSLFKSWFVDATQSVLPKGWRAEIIDNVCSVVTRGVTPKYQEGSGRFIINQRVNRGFELDWSEMKELESDLEVPPAKFARQWDVLVNCLGEGTLGRTHLYLDKSDVFAVDQHMSICRPKTPAVGIYLYQILSSADGQAKIESLKTGSTGMTMFNISKLREFNLVYPTDELLENYFKAAESVFLKIVANRQESRTLAALRDALLPKLLSGELRVPAAKPES